MEYENLMGITNKVTKIPKYLITIKYFTFIDVV